MTVGSAKKTNEKVNANRVTEVYDHSTSLWSTKAFYPYRDVLIDYQMLPLFDDFIIFGGFDEKSNLTVTTIAKFNPTTNIWTKLGNLQFSRYAFGAIEIQKQFLIMGGEGKKRTETCTITGKSIKCKSREPTLNNFQNYPALMVVETDYTERCKKLSTTTSTTQFTTTPKHTFKTGTITYSKRLVFLNLITFNC